MAGNRAEAPKKAIIHILLHPANIARIIMFDVFLRWDDDVAGFDHDEFRQSPLAEDTKAMTTHHLLLSYQCDSMDSGKHLLVTLADRSFMICSISYTTIQLKFRLIDHPAHVTNQHVLCSCPTI